MKDFLGQVEVSESFGTVSKAEVFEELIWIVCKKRVKLKPAPVGGGHDDRAGGHESGRAC